MAVCCSAALTDPHRLFGARAIRMSRGALCASRLARRPELFVRESTIGDLVMTTTYDGPNRGALFRNKYKHKETDLDYSGTLNIGGSEYSLFGWVSTSKNGLKFLRLSVRPKSAAPQKSSASDLNDEIGF
jgi:hypothetical protein